MPFREALLSGRAHGPGGNRISPLLQRLAQGLGGLRLCQGSLRGVNVSI